MASSALNINHEVSHQKHATQTNNYKFPLIVVTVLFFSFGFLTCLNDILVPHLKSFFSLSYTQATLIQFCFFSAYFFMSIPSGKIINYIGYKNGMILGLIIIALGALGFYPATQMQNYSLFLGSLFILATGITLLQVAVNPYVTLLGPIQTSSKRLNLVQAFNSLGTTVAPSIGALFILDQISKPEAVQGPYMIFAISLIIIAISLYLIPLPKIDSNKESNSNSEFNIKNYKNLIKGTFGIFCYVGAEVAIGSFLINYLTDTRLGSINTVTAGKLVSFYWGSAMIGRFIGTYFLSKYSPSLVLMFSVIGSIFLTFTSLFTYGKIAVYSILAVGFFNSIMFPTIFSLSLKDLKEHTAKASGILCTAIVGGALFPLIQGLIADNFSLRISFIIPILGYLYLLYYSQNRYKADIL